MHICEELWWKWHLIIWCVGLATVYSKHKDDELTKYTLSVHENELSADETKQPNNQATLTITHMRICYTYKVSILVPYEH